MASQKDLGMSMAEAYFLHIFKNPNIVNLKQAIVDEGRGHAMHSIIRRPVAHQGAVLLEGTRSSVLSTRREVLLTRRGAMHRMPAAGDGVLRAG